MTLARRSWVPSSSEELVQTFSNKTSQMPSIEVLERVEALALENKRIHERECFNLNPATNVMNPRAEAMLSAGIGSRPSLGYPGDKYEMGLEAIEEIEVIAAELCAEVFGAKFAEIRVPSGAIANLYGFMATCQPGDAIIVPPASIGGHVTHHMSGCAGLYGLRIIEAPLNADRYSIDVDALESLARAENPKLITVGGSLNLFEHPVRDIRQIADTVGAYVMFDAAHQCGIIAGKAWTNPLDEGAHFMTMSTYKSLGGPAGGIIVSNDAEIAERLDTIAFPGMTANLMLQNRQLSRSQCLIGVILGWLAAEMIARPRPRQCRTGVPVFCGIDGFTQSHQFAVRAEPFGGGQAASKILRNAGFLACGIGLPVPAIEGDLNGLRIGTPELVRWGMKSIHANDLAKLIVHGLNKELILPEVSRWRKNFDQIHFIH